MSQTEKSPDDNGEEVRHWESNQLYVKVTCETDELLRKLGAMSSIAGEYRLHFEEGRLWAHAVDPANVCAVLFELPVEYQTSAQEFVVGVNAEQLLSAADMLGDDPETTIRIDREDTEAKVMSYVYMDYFDLIETETMREEPDFDFDYPNSVEVDSMKFKGAVGAVADAATGKVRLTSRDGRLLVEGSKPGGDFEHEWEIEAEVSGNVSEVFSQDYLSDVTASISPEGTLTLHWGENVPLKIDTGAGLEFVLAPTLQNSPKEDNRDG